MPILAATLLILASVPAAAQAPVPGQLRTAPTFAGRGTAPPPDRISLITVENHPTEVGGLYVHMNSAVEIEEVLSPRVFTLRRALSPRYEEMDAEPKVLLVLPQPLPTLGRGALIHVTGWVTTPPTATQVIGADWGASLDEDIRADANRPVVIANVVRSSDGVELSSRP
jgi:hypothetical protein